MDRFSDQGKYTPIGIEVNTFLALLGGGVMKRGFSLTRLAI
jgi:hypothetical protein